jgi:hypothetical protein
MLHIDNVEHVLANGICAKGHPNTDANYINIGDTGLIANRNDYDVKVIPPGGKLGEYVPFYFGTHSPMLLKIKDGNGGVTRRPQSDIVYLLCSMSRVVSVCVDWCFTDGHAKTIITDFYNHTNDLDKVDWDMVGQRYWSNNDDDYDRMRRKQAEFLVKYHVPANCIGAIATYNTAAKSTVDAIITKLGLNIPVREKKHFYY